MKKFAYISLAVLGGLMLGSIVHWLVEAWWIEYALSHGLSLTLHDNLGSMCYLPWPIEGGILLVGLIFGIRFGFWGWRVVYVEHRHWRNRR